MTATFPENFDAFTKGHREHILRWFAYGHLPPETAAVSELFAVLAWKMVVSLPACAERTAGLRKLLEAKDCAVRASMEQP